MVEVRGLAEPHGGAYPPSSPPRRTPSRHSSLPRYGPAGRDGLGPQREQPLARLVIHRQTSGPCTT